MPRHDFTHHPIDQLHADWAGCCHTQAARQAASALAAAEPDIALTGATDLGELVDWLETRQGARERAQAAAVIRAMIRSQSLDPLVPRTLLQAVLPGLVGVARRLSWGSGGEWRDGGQFFGDVVTTAWEVICDWSGDDRPYAVLDLLSAVRCRLRRQVERHRQALARAGDALEEDRVPTVGLSSGFSDLDVLARSIDELEGAGLDPIDGAILYGNRVLGLSIAELAERSGLSRFRVEHRRSKAIAALTASGRGFCA